MLENRYASLRIVGAITLAVLAGVLLLTGGAQARLANEATTPATADESTQLYIPMTTSNRPTTWARNSVFGMQMYNDSRPTSPFHPSLMDSGATWLRIAVHWNSIEPNNTLPSAYLWEQADKPLGAAETPGGYGVRVIGTIETAPVWARYDSFKPDGPINAANMPDFKEFVGALVERFDGDGYLDAPGSPIVDYWEFYNEPDRRLDTTDGRWGQHPTEYAAMLAAVYPVVKSANPDAEVVFGGIAYDFFVDQGGPFIRTFLDDVLAAGAGNYFDVFNFHTYPLFASNWLTAGESGSGLYQKTQHLRAKLQAAGLNKPMIITEAGWHSNNPPGLPSSPETQSRYVAQLFTQSLAGDIDVMIWWMLYDPGEGSADFGLVTRDPEPFRKPSFLAYQTIVNQLTRKDFVKVLLPSETKNGWMEAYEFRDPLTGHTLYVAWLNPIITQATGTLSVAATEVRAIDLYGNVGPVFADANDGAVDGRVSVPVNGQPVYIEVLR
ncbi:MAG: cellulase family glycosylhydrolase [Candidatus Promineofilum sp.]|nr:cellulase family glycosylhydrolase [Promineifilum sp.]